VRKLRKTTIKLEQKRENAKRKKKQQILASSRILLRHGLEDLRVEERLVDNDVGRAPLPHRRLLLDLVLHAAQHGHNLLLRVLLVIYA
jgi:hypothetical protein